MLWGGGWAHGADHAGAERRAAKCCTPPVMRHLQCRCAWVRPDRTGVVTSPAGPPTATTRRRRLRHPLAGATRSRPGFRLRLGRFPGEPPHGRRNVGEGDVRAPASRLPRSPKVIDACSHDRAGPPPPASKGRNAWSGERQLMFLEALRPPTAHEEGSLSTWGHLLQIRPFGGCDGSLGRSREKRF